MSERPQPVALAVGAHPDDIEFMMAGTLLLLKQAGAEVHVWSVANGSCGSTVHDAEAIVGIRRQECEDSARLAGATMHPAIADDLAIFFEKPLLARAAALIRSVRPSILLVPSPQDYMEDHQNACRLAVTAAFVRGMRNFPTDPPTPPWLGDLAVYHAMPYTLRDPLRRLVRAGLYVDVGPVHTLKRRMLACHRSQKEWLDASQGQDAYLDAMEQMSRSVGAMCGWCELAEGWRRRLHVGFGPEDYDPLRELLPSLCRVDEEYEQDLG
jgi:LmbE family N-acetylglucosaminyl deacetylase